MATATQTEDLEWLAQRAAEARPALEQLFETVEHLAESGILAGINGVLEEWDDQFSAITRPEGMTMIANMMMLMGAMSQVRYDMMFDVAMRLPDAINDGYEQMRTRTKPMGTLEMLKLMRSPGMAGVMTMAGTVMSHMQDGANDASAE